MSSTFKVYYATLFTSPLNERQVFGEVTMNERGVKRFVSLPSAHAWLETQAADWLTEVKPVAYRLCASVGHYSKHFASWDENSGIGVERVG